MYKHLTDKEYEFVFKRTPRICVDLVIKTGKKIVLTKRLINPYKGLWHLPGGRVSYKESIHSALKRIARSELGIEINDTPTNLLGYIEFINDGKYVHSLSLVFTINCDLETRFSGNEQAREIESFESVPDETHPAHKQFLIDTWDKILGAH